MPGRARVSHQMWGYLGEPWAMYGPHMIRHTLSLAAAALLLAGCGASTSTDVLIPETRAGASTAASAAEAAPGTVSQRNAQAKAQSYLAVKGFSRRGLIHQLSSDAGDGFPAADAAWAVDHLPGVDWNEQAVRAGKDYLKMTGFSRKSLIEQLSSDAGNQFTVAQATYAASKLGL